MDVKEFKRRFAKAISDRMWDLDINQSELARKIGVSQMTICSWVNRKSTPRAWLIPRLAKVLGCTVSDLIEFEDDT